MIWKIANLPLVISSSSGKIVANMPSRIGGASMFNPEATATNISKDK